MRKVSLLSLLFLASCFGGNGGRNVLLPSVTHPTADGSPHPVHENPNKTNIQQQQEANASKLALPKDDYVKRVLTEGMPEEWKTKNIKGFVFGNLVEDKDKRLVIRQIDDSNLALDPSSIYEYDVLFAGKSIGLTYSDYGHWRSAKISNSEWAMDGEASVSYDVTHKMFAGGNEKYVQNPNLESDSMTFGGRAYAAVVKDDKTKVIFGGDARLDFNPKTVEEKLTVDLNDGKWYKMELTANPGKDTATAKFSKTANFVAVPGYTFDKASYTDVPFKSTYYGKEKVEEVVGTYKVPEDGYSLVGSFGAKRN